MLNIDDRLLDLLPAKPLKLVMKIGSYMGKNGFCFPSIATLANKLGWNEKTVRTHLLTLNQKGIIETFPRFKDDGSQTSNGYRIMTSYMSYYVNLQGKGDKKEVTPSQKVVPPPSQKVVDEVLTNEVLYNIVEKQSFNDDIKTVVAFLNEESGANYREKTKATRKHIAARLREGFTVSDFEKVIKHKVAEWKGTPNEKYLRPQTLFASKFEGYLQSAESIERKQQDQTIKEELKEGYNIYLKWVQSSFPRLVANIQFLSKTEYESYHKDNYLRNLTTVGKSKKRKVLEQCHEQFASNPQIERNYNTVWGYYCQSIKKHIKTASVC